MITLLPFSLKDFFLKFYLLSLIFCISVVSSYALDPSIVSINGESSEGNLISIMGSNFDEKSRAEPLFWDRIDNQPDYESLNEGDIIPTGENFPWNNAGSPWADKPTFSINREHRTNSVSEHYFFEGKSFIKEPNLNTSQYIDSLYISWWLKPNMHPYSRAGSNKFVRIWDHSSGDGTRISWTSMHLTYPGDDGVSWNTWSGDANTWNRNEIWVDDTTNTIQTRVNSQIEHEITDFSKKENYSSNSLYLALLGFDASSGGDYTDFEMDVGEIYIDSTQARIELCDSSNWNTTTHCELQLPKNWSNDELQFEFYQGSFETGDTAYAYVIDKDGNVNQQGYEITLGQIVNNSNNSWKLPDGNFIPAKMPMHVVYPRPDNEASSHARHRWAHPGMSYEIPVGVQGGSWPFKYELIEAPTGATIGSTPRTKDYGVIKWSPSSSSGSYTFKVKITDQEYNTVITNWSVEINADKFTFIEDGAPSGGDGSIDSPLEDFSDWFNDDEFDTTYLDQIIVFREGNYFAIGDPNNNNNIRLNEEYKTSSLIGFPGEKATLDMSEAKILTWQGNKDLFVADLHFKDGRQDVNNAHFFWAMGDVSRSTWWRNHFDTLGPGTVGNDNTGPVFVSGTGTLKENIMFKDNLITNIDNIGYNGHYFEVYVTNHVLYEGNVAKDSTTTSGFYPKGARAYVTVRDNTAIENVTGGQIKIGNGGEAKDVPHHIEVAWNNIRSQSNSIPIFMYSASTYYQGEHYENHIYRNTLYGPSSWVRFPGLDKYYSDGNVVTSYDNMNRWQLDSMVSNIVPNLLSEQKDILVNSTNHLKGEYRDNYLGKRGFELGLRTITSQDNTTQENSDNQNPSQVNNLRINSTSTTSITIKWDSATDNEGIKNYIVYRNGSNIITTSQLSFLDSNLESNKTYSYRVSAVDTSNNEGSKSTVLQASTLEIKNNSSLKNPSNNSWKLPEGNFIPAKMPMHVVYPRPDTETSPHARHRWAHPDMPYEIPVGVQGGSWPFKYELLEAPSGATINSIPRTKDYGVIKWSPSSNSGTYTFKVKITDQEYNTITTNWSVEINADKFTFIEDGALSGGDGSIESPLEDFSHWFNNDEFDTTYLNQIIVFREGNYFAIGDPNNNNNVRFNEEYKTSSLIGFPGEKATLDMSEAKILTWQGNKDLFVADLHFKDGRQDVNNAHFFWAMGDVSRSTWWRNHFDTLGPGTVGNDNTGPVFVSGTESIKENIMFKDNLLTNIDNVGYNGHYFEAYRTDYFLIEGNVAKDSTSSAGFFPKCTRSYITVRDNTAIENVTGKQITVGNACTYDIPHHNEVAWNNVRVETDTSSYPVLMFSTSNNHQGEHYENHIYRNTFYAGSSWVRFEGVDKYYVDGNVVTSFSNMNRWNENSMLTQLEPNLLSEQKDILVNSTNHLKGEYRENYLGKRGFELGFNFSNENTDDTSSKEPNNDENSNSDNQNDDSSSGSTGSSSNSGSSGSSGSSSSGGGRGSFNSDSDDQGSQESRGSGSTQSDSSSYVAPSCQSDFTYSAWSSCVDGTQFRIVTDQNSCVDATQETRICQDGADENEIKELNAKEIQFAKMNNRRYETSFSDSYNEMVYTNEKLEDESFVVVDSRTNQQYLGTLVNEDSGKYYYTLERVDQNNVNKLKEQGLAERSLTESVTSAYQNFKNSQNFISVLVILSLFGITTIIYVISRYMKKIHKKNNYFSK